MDDDVAVQVYCLMGCMFIAIMLRFCIFPQASFFMLGW